LGHITHVLTLISAVPANQYRDDCNFYKAAVSVLDTSLGLCAGGAFHLAVTLEYKVQGIVSLDAGLVKNAKSLKIKVISI